MSVSYSAYQPSGQLGSKLEHVIITFQKNEIPLFGRAVEVVGWQSIFIVILCTLKQYWFEKGRPRGILFPNKFTGNYLTVSTLEQVMRRAVSDAELPAGATPHCLRHSFATHLMEQGVERQNIQALLGHRDPKSTEVYLHVSNKSLMGIQSPFDRKEGAGHE